MSTSKKLNIILVVFVVLFCLIWGGYGVFKYNLLKDLDSKHDQETEQGREQEKNDTKNDITINNNNDNNNSSNPTVPDSGNSGSTDSVDISKFNFVQMYEYAEKKLNGCKNVLSEGSGTAYLTGPTSMAGIKLNNEKVSINFTRAQNSTQKFFNFKIAGPLLDGIFMLNYETAAYQEGGIYYYYFNQQNVGWKPMASQLIAEKLAFEFNQSYIDVNSDSIVPETATPLTYDKYAMEYSGSVELKPEVACTRYAKTLKGVLDANDVAKFSKTKINVTFDRFGNFKSINFVDTFKVDVRHSETGVTMYATINSDFTEVFKVCGNSKSVIITKPSGIK